MTKQPIKELMSPSQRAAYHQDQAMCAIDCIEGNVLLAKTFQTGFFVQTALLQKLGETNPHIVVWLDPGYRGEPKLEDLQAAGLDPANMFIIQTNGRPDSIRQWTEEYKRHLAGQHGRPHVTIVLDEIHIVLGTGHDTKAAIRELVEAANKDGDTQVIVIMFVRSASTVVTPLEEWLEK